MNIFQNFQLTEDKYLGLNFNGRFATTTILVVNRYFAVLIVQYDNKQENVALFAFHSRKIAIFFALEGRGYICMSL